MERLIVVLTAGQLTSQRNCLYQEVRIGILFTGTRIRR
jgi:hypothetical protein